MGALSLRPVLLLWEQTLIGPSHSLTGWADFPYHGLPTKAQTRPGLLAFLGETRQGLFLSDRQIEPFTQAGE